MREKMNDLEHVTLNVGEMIIDISNNSDEEIISIINAMKKGAGFNQFIILAKKIENDK
jgi:hypothetical protein